MDKHKDTNTENGECNENTLPDESPSIDVSGHIVIRDPESGEVFVDKSE
jgi:hypothetical protein